MKEKLPKKNILLIIVLMLAALIVIYFGAILRFLSTLWRILIPITTGTGLAYVMDMIRTPLDRLILPHAKNKAALKIKHVLLIALIFILITAFVICVIALIIPSVSETGTVFADSIPTLLKRLKAWVNDNSEYLPAVAEKINEFDFSVQELIGIITTYLTDGVSGLINSTIGVIASTFSIIFSIVMSCIFSLYVIYNKTKLKRQCKRLICVYLPSPTNEKMLNVLRTANTCFHSFIVSQGLQAIILAVLCILGMLLFGFPEPMMIGIFMGVTALIPLVGSYIGPPVGFFIVLAMQPGSAIWFLVFIICLEQLVGNVIYPKIAGRSFGLPGMWVLASVVVGGGLFGFLGMIIGPPVTATIYQLLRKHTQEKEMLLRSAERT